MKAAVIVMAMRKAAMDLMVDLRLTMKPCPSMDNAHMLSSVDMTICMITDIMLAIAMKRETKSIVSDLMALMSKLMDLIDVLTRQEVFNCNIFLRSKWQPRVLWTMGISVKSRRFRRETKRADCYPSDLHRLLVTMTEVAMQKWKGTWQTRRILKMRVWSKREELAVIVTRSPCRKWRMDTMQMLPSKRNEKMVESTILLPLDRPILDDAHVFLIRNPMSTRMTARRVRT